MKLKLNFTQFVTHFKKIFSQIEIFDWIVNFF